MPITVSQLAIAPVKGLRLAPVDELELQASGALGDRAFVVVDDENRLLLTARTPALVQVAQRWDPASGELTLSFPDGGEVAGVPDPGEAMSTGLYDGRRVSGRLAAGPHSDALSDHLGRPVRLVALDPGEVGADDFPLTLMSTASVAALGQALDGGAPDPRRFRMTITVEGAGAWEENGWAGQELEVGEARLRVAEPVPRCVVTTRDPDSGRRDVPVLKTLAELHGKKNVNFGVWCEVARAGRVRTGDLVVALGTAQARDSSRAMSQENVEVVRLTFEAIGRWDIETLLTLYDPDIEYLPLTGTRVESGGYVGHAGVREYFEEVADIWEELHPHADDVRTVGDHVVVLGGCAVRGRGSGAESDAPMAWVLTVRDGKITRHRGYRTGSEALEAVGLEE